MRTLSHDLEALIEVGAIDLGPHKKSIFTDRYATEKSIFVDKKIKINATNKNCSPFLYPRRKILDFFEKREQMMKTIRR